MTIFLAGLQQISYEIYESAHIDGVNFQGAYKSRKNIKIESLPIPFISKENLIKNKQSTGREKDRLDANYLRKNKNA